MERADWIGLVQVMVKILGLVKAVMKLRAC